MACEDIGRASRDTYNSLKVERQLADNGIALFAADEPASIEGVNPTMVLVAASSRASPNGTGCS